MTTPHIALPFLWRTRRKVDEARFFLRKLEDCGEKRPEFDYYLSAFLAAIRNVGWIIQSELRPFGSEFDAWWVDAKMRMPEIRIPFSVLTTLRNQSVKSGELLPGLATVINLRDGLGSIHLTLKTENGRIDVADVKVKFDRSPVIITQPAEPDPKWPEPQFLAAAPDMWEAVEEVLKGAEMNRVGYVLDLDHEPLTFAEMMEGFRQHVESMSAAVDDAERVFGEKQPTERF